MLDTILFYVHSGVLVLFGVCLSLAFGGIAFSWRNVLTGFTLGLLCGALQLGVYLHFAEEMVWKLYPIVTHLPVVLVLCFVYHRHIFTAIAAVSTAYLYCQPAKWCSELVSLFVESETIHYGVRIAVLIVVAAVTLRYLAGQLAQLYCADLRSVCIFGLVPAVYYVFDYATAVYTGLWIEHNQAVLEFLPFFLSVVFMVFCLVYHKEYGQKREAERKEQLIQIAVEQQAKEIEAARRSEQEVRLLRHDMRFLLGRIAALVDNGDYEKAQEQISAYTSHIDSTKVERYCENETVNYVLSDFVAKCAEVGVQFNCTVNLSQVKVDELLFASILANGLDNALNAQRHISEGARQIKVMIKDAEDKLLLSIKNPVEKQVVFADGLPVSHRKGHGYGTQSIRYTTKQLGGNCQFSVQDGQFIMRVIL